MSVYKFIVSKNNIAKDSDSNITYDDTNGGADVTVTLTVNGKDIHAVTLGDSGAVMQYTGTLAAGWHTVKIRPEAGKPTDIRIDRVIIDDHTVVGSQYKIETRIFGKDSDYLQYLCCPPFRSPKRTDHVWWGDVYSADYTIKSKTTHYRPHVVTDLGEWWQWSFSVNSSGQIHWQVDESDDVFYDSTANHNYYAAKSTLYNDSATFPLCNYNEVDAMFDSSDSTSPGWDSTGLYDSSFVFDYNNVDYGPNHVPLATNTEWYDAAWYYKCYWPANDIDPIVIT
jgi:hypothetical protein